MSQGAIIPSLERRWDDKCRRQLLHPQVLSSHPKDLIRRTSVPAARAAGWQGGKSRIFNKQIKATLLIIKKSCSKATCFPGRSADKESACSAGDLGSIPGLGKSTGERIGFPCGSAGKESTCNTGDPGLICGSGRFPGEGIGYPLQYSWASLVAETVKNPPAVQETWVRCLDWEDLLKEGMATHSSILAWRIPMDRGAWQVIVHGVAKSQTRLSN